MPRHLRKLIFSLFVFAFAACIIAPSLANAMYNCPLSRHWEGGHCVRGSFAPISVRKQQSRQRAHSSSESR
jgi:hypothetical protein